MGSYVVRRIANFVPTLVIMSFVVFVILTLAPGDPLTRYEQALQVTYNYSAKAAKDRTDLLRERYGFTQPFVVRYVNWLGRFMQGDFGVSFDNFQPVSNLVGPRLLYSMTISLSAFVFMYVIGIPIGIWTAYRQYGISDYVVSVGAFLGLSIPDFFLALLVLVGLFYIFDIPPPQGLFSPQYVDAPWTAASELRMSIIMITHDLGVVAGIADEVAVMYLGELVERSSTSNFFAKRLHPYTQGLLNALPVLGAQQTKKFNPIPGIVPDPLSMPEGCRFSDRCAYRMAVCAQPPPFVAVEPDHLSRCWLHTQESSRKEDSKVVEGSGGERDVVI